jgi:hypothetical protein
MANPLLKNRLNTAKMDWSPAPPNRLVRNGRRRDVLSTTRVHFLASKPEDGRLAPPHTWLS